MKNKRKEKNMGIKRSLPAKIYKYKEIYYANSG